MKNETALFTMAQELQMKRMFKEIEERFPNSEVTFDESMLKVFREMSGTEDDMEFLTGEVLEKVSWAYSEYLLTRIKERVPRNHTVKITVCAEEGTTFDILTEMSAETENEDGIKRVGELGASDDAPPKASCFAHYLPANIVIDGFVIVKNGKIMIPDDVDVSCISKKEVATIIEQYNLTVSVEEARLLLVDPIRKLPIREDIIRWVLDESNGYIAKQPDSEEGRKNIEFARQHFNAFATTFESKYDEAELVDTILNYYGMQKASDNLVMQGYLQTEIRKKVATLLLFVYDMTEYDIFECYEKE